MSNDNTVRAAQIGIGAWSRVIANGVQRSDKIKLVTCFTRTPEKRKAFSEEYGCDQEESFEDVVKRDDVDAVLLTTPNAIHAEQAVMAAEHGKHIFVEKPIGNTIEDGKKIINACRENGSVLMVGQDIRRLSGYRKMKALIDGGTIGDPVMAESNFSADLGFNLTPDKFRWRGDDSGCPAGALMTMGIHHVDTLNYLFGPIKTAFSFFNKLYIPADVEDVTMTIFQFESGILGYLGSNYATPRAHWLYVYGTKANLFCRVTLPEVSFEEYLKIWAEVDQYTELVLFEKGIGEMKNIPLDKGDIILEQIDEFADCILEGKKPETDGECGLTALALVRAAIDSAKTGKLVNIQT